MTDVLTLAVAAVGAAVLITAPSMGPTVPVRKGLAWIVARVAWWFWWAVHPDAVRRSRLDLPDAIKRIEGGRAWARARGDYYASCPLCLSVWTALGLCAASGAWGAAWGVLAAPALVWGVTSLSGRVPNVIQGSGGCGGDCGKARKVAKGDPLEPEATRALNGSRASV